MLTASQVTENLNATMPYSLLRKQTMNFNEQFTKMIERSRAGSTTTPFQEPREWYLDKNGVVVSKPIESNSSKAALRRQQ